MKYWWVNQNQTYKAEVGGGFLWSPKTRTDGARNHFYDNMREVEPGDVIFSFCDTRIKAVGIATQVAVSAAKPDFGAAGGTWSAEGWLVQVEFAEFAKPIRPKDFMAVLRPHLPDKYSPLQANGDGLQSVYLAGIEHPFAAALINVIGSDYDAALDSLVSRVTPDEDASGLLLEAKVLERTDIGPTQKQQLVNARRGQGLFRANVRLHEKKCRITQVTDPEHLRASHIKPWKDSTDKEKLDGSNGLMLAPHIDHLFDRGFISFDDNGDLLIATNLTNVVLRAWALVPGINVGTFNDRQLAYMEYHRRMVFNG
jgi:hypothetical protein